MNDTMEDTMDNTMDRLMNDTMDCAMENAVNDAEADEIRRFDGRPFAMEQVSQSLTTTTPVRDQQGGEYLAFMDKELTVKVLVCV